MPMTIIVQSTLADVTQRKCLPRVRFCSTHSFPKDSKDASAKCVLCKQVRLIERVETNLAYSVGSMFANKFLSTGLFKDCIPMIRVLLIAARRAVKAIHTQLMADTDDDQ